MAVASTSWGSVVEVRSGGISSYKNRSCHQQSRSCSNGLERRRRVTSTRERSRVAGSLGYAVSLGNHEHRQERPNPPMHPTPLRVDKIVGFLEGESRSSRVPIYRAARVMGNPLGRPSMPCHLRWITLAVYNTAKAVHCRLSCIRSVTTTPHASRGDENPIASSMSSSSAWLNTRDGG